MQLQLLLLPQIDWESVAKIWGPLGVSYLLLVLVIWKVLVPYIKQLVETNREDTRKLADDNRVVLGAVIDDARKERDYVRVLREQEVTRFIESMKLRDEIMKASMEGVTRSIEVLSAKIK